MPSRDDILREQTHKEEEDDIGRRVFYTLWGDNDSERSRIQRTAKLLGLLFEHLESKGLLSSAELDELLFQTVM